ncbi:MAG: helix-turn-helix domain-containing protein [Desulfobacteraceae bacterium]|jgi:curved DNA-binding protein CbpA
MKNLDSRTFYEVLQVPEDAKNCDIKRAYHDALEIYSDNALVTYTLFSDQQRSEILKSIKTAFDTLIDEKKRADYNRMLTKSGQAFTSAGADRVGKQFHILSYALNKSKADVLDSWVRMKLTDGKITTMVDTILGKDEISGLDLKRLRRAFGIELSEIYEVTRISKDMITYIEEDRFDALPAQIYLKQFLRSYAEIFQIDPEHIIHGYLKNMSMS